MDPKRIQRCEVYRNGIPELIFDTLRDEDCPCEFYEEAPPSRPYAWYKDENGNMVDYSWDEYMKILEKWANEQGKTLEDVLREDEDDDE